MHPGNAFFLVRLSLSHVLPPPHSPLPSFAAFIPLLSASVISSLLSNAPFPCGRCSPLGLPPLVLALPPVCSWTTWRHQLGDTVVAHNWFVYAYVWMMDLWLEFGWFSWYILNSWVFQFVYWVSGSTQAHELTDGSYLWATNSDLNRKNLTESKNLNVKKKQSHLTRECVRSSSGSFDLIACLIRSIH